MTWIMSWDGTMLVNSSEVAEFRNAGCHLRFRYRGAIDDQPLVVVKEGEDPQVINDLLWTIFNSLRYSPEMPLDLMEQKKCAIEMLKRFPLPKRLRGVNHKRFPTSADEEK